MLTLQYGKRLIFAAFSNSELLGRTVMKYEGLSSSLTIEDRSTDSKMLYDEFHASHMTG